MNNHFKYYFKKMLLAIVLLNIIIFMVQNQIPVQYSFFHWELTLSKNIITIIMLLGGIAICKLLTTQKQKKYFS